MTWSSVERLQGRRNSTREDFHVIDNLAGRVDELGNLFAGEWWTAQRSPTAIDRMLDLGG